MDGFLSKSLNHVLARLESDLVLLRKLLYRNSNQHGNTVSYSYCRRVMRALSLCWKKECILPLQPALLESLRIRIGETKITQEVVEKVVLQSVAITMTLASGTKALHLSVKAYEALTELLRKQVFLPLFTVLWSLMARIYRSLREVLLPLHEAHQHLDAIVQHVSAVSGNKYSQLLSPKVRTTLQLPVETLKVLEQLQRCSSLGVEDDEDLAADVDLDADLLGEDSTEKEIPFADEDDIDNINSQTDSTKGLSLPAVQSELDLADEEITNTDESLPKLIETQSTKEKSIKKKENKKDGTGSTKVMPSLDSTSSKKIVKKKEKTITGSEASSKKRKREKDDIDNIFGGM